MATTDYTVSRELTITTTGSKFTAQNLGYSKDHTIIYFYVNDVSTGNVLVAFGDETDSQYITVTLPFELKGGPRFKEIWLKSDQGTDQTVNVIASIGYTSGNVL